MKYDIQNAKRVGLAAKLFDNKIVVGCVAGKSNTAYLITLESKNYEDGPEHSVVSYSFGEPKYDEPWAGGEGWGGLKYVKATMMKPKSECLMTVSATGHIGIAGKCLEGDDFHIHNESIIHGINLVGEHVYIVGPSRTIYRRTGVKEWSLFNQGTQDDLMLKNIEKSRLTAFTSYGLLSIDGFTEKDMYAVGNKGEAWHYDGKKWSTIDLPTNVNFHKVHCAKDGNVYIAGDDYTILKGKGDNWDFILSPKIDHPFNYHLFEAIAWFDDALYIGTSDGLYKFINENFEKIPLTPPEFITKPEFDIEKAKALGWDDEMIETLSDANELTDDTPNESISCLDTNFGYLLAGRTHGGLYRYDGETWEVVAVTK